MSLPQFKVVQHSKVGLRGTVSSTIVEIDGDLGNCIKVTVPFVVPTLESTGHGNVSGFSCLSSEAKTNPTRERGERNCRSIVLNFQNPLSPEIADARGTRPRSRVEAVIKCSYARQSVEDCIKKQRFCKPHSVGSAVWRPQLRKNHSLVG